MCWVINSPVLPRCCVVTPLPLMSLTAGDAGVGRHDDLEILRIERGEVADLAVLLVEGRIAEHGVGGRDGVAEADLGLGLLDAADIGDAGAGQRLDREARDRLLPDVFQLAAERHPDAALRAGHQTQILRHGGSAKQESRRRDGCADPMHRFPPRILVGRCEHELSRLDKSGRCLRRAGLRRLVAAVASTSGRLALAGECWDDRFGEIGPSGPRTTYRKDRKMPDTSSGERRISGPRLIALVGPFQSGKTTLLESILVRSGGIAREGRVADGTSVGDSSAEARAHVMSVEANVASVDYLGDRYTFVDCPGSVEFLQDMRAALPACDAAVVVCEADERKIPALQVILRELEELKVPRFLFLNKIDLATMRVRETLQILQPASRTPLLLRQIPIWNQGIATGFIDLALERAFIYREHAPSAVVDVPAGEVPREKEARYSMLEKLADYDDELMEELLSDIEPPRDRVFDDLAKELRGGHVVPLLIGSAERGNGVTRLLKALRHEAPGVESTRERLGVPAEGPPLAHCLRTVHTAHGGKLSLSRSLRGTFADGAHVIGSRGVEERIAGLSRLVGATATKHTQAAVGDTLAFGRLDSVMTGDAIAEGRVAPRPIVTIAAPQPVHVFALSVKDRKDEVRLNSALGKLVEEDPSLVFLQDQTTGELKVMGQGEMHLRVSLERLAARFGVHVEAHKPQVGYRETIRESVAVRGRHKKQSGGHGQFGDVAITVAPRARGEGFAFSETVHGGSVPRQYFTSSRGRGDRRTEPRSSRFSGCGRRGDAHRWLVSHGRFLRHGVPDGDEDRHGGGPAESPAGAARTDSGRRHRRALGASVARHRTRLGAARADSGL
jgi:elongation factor G